MQEEDYQRKDSFERAREALWGTPGFQVKSSTVIAPGTTWVPQATWIVQTVRTDETSAIFLQFIGQDGGQRLVIPHKVAQAIYRHYERIMKVRRSERAKRAAKTRQGKE